MILAATVPLVFLLTLSSAYRMDDSKNTLKGAAPSNGCALWHPASPLPRNLQGHSSWTDNTDVLVFGGCAKTSTMHDCSTDLYRLDGVSLQWTKLILETPFTVTGAAAATDPKENRHYLFGGARKTPGSPHISFSNELSVLQYSQGGYQWVPLQVATSPPKTAESVMEFYNHCLYVFGGFSDEGFIASVYKLDLSSDPLMWEQLTVEQGPSGRKGHASAMIGSKLTVMGGVDGETVLNDLWQLDLSERRLGWVKLRSDGITARSGHASASNGKELVVFGGCDFERRQCYDDLQVFKNGRWIVPQFARDQTRFNGGQRYQHSMVYVEGRYIGTGGCGRTGCVGDTVVFESEGVCESNCMNGVYRAHRCHCSPGFQGKFCSIPITECPFNCSGHGVCDTFCRCEEEWTGVDCSQLRCPSDCSFQGVCSKGECKCFQGFQGENCALNTRHHKKSEKNTSPPLKCRNDCSKIGVCFNGGCKCPPGTGGEDCSQLETCTNCSSEGGVCFNGKCVCKPGYSGTSCGKSQCSKECSKHGICVDGFCVCESGWEGAECAVIKSGKASCEDCGMGVCHLNKCFCAPGWEGDDCSIRLDMCPNHCNGGGTCAFGKCFCDPGRSGEYCEVVETCHPDCHRNGICAMGKCFCVHGWTGENCMRQMDGNATRSSLEMDLALSNGFSGNVRICSGKECRGMKTSPLISRCRNGCSGNGVCVFGKCLCDPFHEGMDCSESREVSCPEDCNGNGVCQYGRCICDEGWDGLACSITVMEKSASLIEENTILLAKSESHSHIILYTVVFMAFLLGAFITVSLHKSTPQYQMFPSEF